ncbi:MAG: hypothetical protein ACKV22_18750 [Bryobacteraceae bacterium]
MRSKSALSRDLLSPDLLSRELLLCDRMYFLALGQALRRGLLPFNPSPTEAPLSRDREGAVAPGPDLFTAIKEAVARQFSEYRTLGGWEKTGQPPRFPISVLWRTNDLCPGNGVTVPVFSRILTLAAPSPESLA